MANCCKSCKIMGKYKYWNETSTIKHSFLKRMEGSSLLRMAIPKEFKDCFKRELAQWCILLGPSGNGWRVRVRRSENNIFFFEGWVNFVKDHGLKLGDLCVFSYTSASTFKVLIFKQSGSEREKAYFTHNSSSFPSPRTCSSSLHIQQNKKTYFTHNSSSFPSPLTCSSSLHIQQNKKTYFTHNSSSFPSPLTCSISLHIQQNKKAYFTHNSSSFPSPVTCSSSLHIQQNNFCEDEPDEELEDESKIRRWFEEPRSSDFFSLDSRGVVHKTGKGKAPKSTEEHDETHKNEDEDEAESQYKDETSAKKRGRPSTSQDLYIFNKAKRHQTFHIPRRRAVTKEEVQRAYDKATAYVINNVSELPSIRITMLWTHIYQGFYMTISKQWALEHMCQEDHNVKLRVPGVEGSWSIGCRWTPNKARCQLRGRWPIFVRDNNLKEHDVCVFKMVQKGNPRKKINAVFDVHIFRVVDEVVPLKKVGLCN